jgi:hypothetical protein
MTEGLSAMKRFAVAMGAMALLASAARAEVRIGLEAGGGSVIHLGAGQETGNSFGGILSVRWESLVIGFGSSTVMPDSRTQGQFTSLWGEVRYHFLRAIDLIEPYGIAGLGGTLSDDFRPESASFVPVRWSETSEVIGFIGAGLRLGRPQGMSLAFDARIVNFEFVALQLMVGFTL